MPLNQLINQFQSINKVSSWGVFGTLGESRVGEEAVEAGLCNVSLRKEPVVWKRWITEETARKIVRIQILTLERKQNIDNTA